MPAKRFAGLRERLLIVVGLALLPVLLFGGYLVQSQWRAARSSTQDEALRAVRFGVARYAELDRSTGQWLSALVRVPEIRAPSRDCEKLYRGLLAGSPMYVELGVAGPNGAVRCSTHPRARLPDETYFLRVLEQEDYASGGYRVDNGQPQITFAHRVLQEGRLAAVIYVTLDLTWLDRVATEALLPERSTLNIVDDQGTLLARYPAVPGWVGRPFLHIPMMKAIVNARGEGTVEGEGLDGAARLYAYSLLPAPTGGRSVYFCVGIPADIAYASVNRMLQQILLGAGIVAFLVLYALYKGLDRLVLRHIQSLLGTTRRLAGGDLSVRTRIPHYRGEIGELARTVDEMAGTLQRRERESHVAQQALAQSEARFRRLAENARDIIFRRRLHPTPACEYMSPAVSAVTGYTPDEHYADATLLDRIVHPDDRSRIESAIQEGRLEEAFQVRLVRKDRRIVWVELSLVPIRDGAGTLVAVEGVARDVTERRRTEDELRLLQSITASVSEAEDLDAAMGRVLREVCEATGWVMGQAWVPDGHSLRASPAWYGSSPALQAYRALSQQTAVPMDAPGLIAQVWRTREPMWLSDMAQPEFRRAAAARAAGLRAAMILPVLADAEVEAVIEFYMHELRPEDGLRARTITGIAAQLGAIIRRKRSEKRLHYLAHHDVLTGLPNRALFYDRLRQAIYAADRLERLVGVAFIDLDRFKTINDSLGHETGDRLLQAVALRLKDCLRAGDTVARISGDEFALVLSGMEHVDDAARVAEKVLDSLRQPFMVDGYELYASASLGITIYPFDDLDVEELLRNADVAMYRAKEQGRNTYQFYAAEMTLLARERLVLEGALRRALERDELVLHYQPIVDLQSDRILGVEALLRWRHPDRGLVAPAQFIPIAEETGLIVPIGEWVLRTACAQCRAWEEAGYGGLRLSVNISPRQFQRPELPDTVARVLAETKFPAERLELELTESLLMHNVEATISAMKQLKAKGVELSIDDFGTGYSSLTYLKRLPIDRLKIDRTFVQDIPNDADDAAIATAIIAIGHRLDLIVVAEGVETPAQLTFLRTHGCEVMQGFYFSRPLEAERLADLLQRPPGHSVPRAVGARSQKARD